MNKKQLISLWIGIIAIVLMGLFPPWMIGYSNKGLYCTTGTYHYILDPLGILDDLEENQIPQMEIARRIDLHQLVVQWVIVSAITGGLIVTFKDKKPKDE